MIDKNKLIKTTAGGLFVFRHYIPGDWKENIAFRNPFRDDHNPSMSVYLGKDGEFLVKDHGDERWNGNICHLVGMLKGIPNKGEGFKQILEIINREMNLGLDSDGFKPTRSTKKQNNIVEQKQIIDDKTSTTEIKEPTYKEYSYSTLEFSKKDLEFWGASGITKDILIRYNVVALATLTRVSDKGKSSTFTYRANDPLYGYLFDDYLKTYRPKEPEYRFMYAGNTPEIHCFGLNQLPQCGDILFIVGGEKDVMSLAAKGFSAICFKSEADGIKPEFIKKLAYRFQHIVILFDVDEPGLGYSIARQRELQECNALRLLLPLEGTKQSKDISDYFREGRSANDLKLLFNQLLEKTYSDTMSILNSCKISLELPPPESEVVISINNVPLGTNGDLLCITGGEGSGKSNFVGALMSGAINIQEKEIDTLGVTVAPSLDGKPILFFDTEQSQRQVWKNVDNVKRRSKCDDVPNELYPYSFVRIPREMRLKTIKDSIDLFYHKYNGVHMVVIDGIADLISSANNETESIALVEDLYKLAGRFKTCIVCVLHFIPNGVKLRGHLGSELQRKAAAILSIEKEREEGSAISLIKALKVRDGSPLDIPIMQFAWDKKERMHKYIGNSPKGELTKRKYQVLKDAAISIFTNTTILNIIEFEAKITQYFDIQECTVKDYISFMREKRIIAIDSDNNVSLNLKI